MEPTKQITQIPVSSGMPALTKEKKKPTQTPAEKYLESSQALLNIIKQPHAPSLETHEILSQEVIASEVRVEEIKQGRIKVSGINNGPIPAYKKTDFDLAKHQKQLDRLSQFPDKKEMPVGCSSTLNLISDYFHSWFKQCFKDPKLGLQKQDPPEFVCNFLSKKIVMNKSNLLKHARLEFQFNIGFVLSDQSRGNYWHRPLGTLTQTDTCIDFDKNYQTIETSFKSLKYYFKLIDIPGSAGERVYDVIDLLENIIFHRKHELEAPLPGSDPTIDHLERLKIRVAYLKELVENFEKTVITLLPKEIQNECQIAFKQEKIELMEFCLSLEKSLEELTESDSSSLQSFRNFYCLLRKFISPYLAFSGLISSKYLKLYQSEIRVRVVSLVSAMSIFYCRCLDSIVQEGFILILKRLVELNRLSLDNLDEMLTNTYNLFEIDDQSFKNFKLDHIKLLEIPFLSSQEERILNELKILTSSFLTILKSSWQGIKEVFKDRMNSCRKSDSTLMDRLLTIRDFLVLTKRHLIVDCAVAYDSSKQIMLDLEKKSQSPDLMSALISASHYFQLCEELFQVAVNSIEGRLGQCFEDVIVQEKLVVEEAGVKLLIDEETQQAKRKKKKKTKKLISVKPPSIEETLQIEKVEQKLETLTTDPMPSDKGKKIKKNRINLEEFVYSDALKNIRACVSEIKTIEVSGKDSKFRINWRNSCLDNFEHAFYQLIETINKSEFSPNTVFSETNTMRRLLEFALEIVLAIYPVLDEKEESILIHARRQNHQLHLAAGHILHISAEKTIPKNVRMIVSAFLTLPKTLSQANECVNYLYSTSSRQRLSDQTTDLIKYLKRVDAQSETKNFSKDDQKKLLEKHKKLMYQGLFFIQELFSAIFNPEYGLEQYTAAVQNTSDILNVESLEMEPDFYDERDLAHHLKQEVEKTPDEAIARPIHSKEDAISVINDALLWLRLRMLTPAEGYSQNKFRYDQRNSAFANVNLYLRRLKELFNTTDTTNLYNLCCEPLDLMTRALKEFQIGLLFHGCYYVENQHIIEAKQLRHVNNPCYVNGILRSYSSRAAFIPDLNIEQFSWMHRAHQVLSYPVPPPSKSVQLKFYRLEENVKAIVDRARELSKKKKNSSLPDEEGFATIKKKGDTCLRDFNEFVKNQDDEKIFPALAALQQIIRYGVALPKSALQI